MSHSAASLHKSVRPTDRAIAAYYAELQAQKNLGEYKEGSTRITIANLLRDVCSPLAWTFTAEKRYASAPGRSTWTASCSRAI